MAAIAGSNTTMAKIFTMIKKEISIVRPSKRETRAGREMGTKSEETTTIMSTSHVDASKRLEMKGATTPVEIPERSRTGRAYLGQMAWVRKKRLLGMTRSFKRHNAKRREVFFLKFCRTSPNSIFRKLKNRTHIMK